jgi:glycosyltransferase involved in cell wall biosynthesis
LQGDSLKVNGYSDHGIEVTENGILCEPDNVEALTSALKKMMVDEEYRKEVQRNAIERSKFYNKEHTMDRWEEYLKIVIS